MSSWSTAVGRKTERGFTLLEVLVAFVILSMALGVILQIFSLTMRTTASSSAYQQALLLAESRLAEISSGNDLRSGRDSGRFDDRFDWTSDVERYEFPDQDPTVENWLVPYRIDVTVHWDPNQSVKLSTIRLAIER